MRGRSAGAARWGRRCVTRGRRTPCCSDAGRLPAAQRFVGARTVKALHLQVNTVHYRIQRLEALTGRSSGSGPRRTTSSRVMSATDGQPVSVMARSRSARRHLRAWAAPAWPFRARP
ncbi:helix-turn-helix domain-containing protein [Streptomyces aurantiacus]|uniref:helix-turn-helix domain-containing protein n=1 Tax=Streptomyces aurantiacus TaxID=47760 RepID=UPI0037DA636F